MNEPTFELLLSLLIVIIIAFVTVGLIVIKLKIDSKNELKEMTRLNLLSVEQARERTKKKIIFRHSGY